MQEQAESAPAVHLCGGTQVGSKGSRVPRIVNPGNLLLPTPRRGQDV